MNPDEKFKSLMKQYNKDICPKCGREIAREDVFWVNGTNEEGEEYCMIEIECDKCGEEILRESSWYPSVRNLEELVENVLEEVLEKCLQ